MATSTSLPKVTQYVKNVGKSIAFASVDAVKANAPGIKGFMEYHDDVFKEAYGSVRNYRQTIRNTEKSIRQSNLFKAVEVGLKNMAEDARTGNFYNDRTADYANDALGLGEDDFDMEFSVSESSSAKSVTDSFNAAIGAAATSHSTAVAESTNLIVKGNIASTKLLISGMDQMTARLSSSMGAVYAAVDRTNQFLNTAMVAHIENSRKYYETTTNIMREQQLMMKEMLEMQRNLYKAKDKEYKESRLAQSVRYDGSANIPGYLKNIKGNITDMMDSYGLGSMKMDIGGGNPFMLYAAAPFKLILEPLFNRMMSKDFKTALRSFDKSVTNFFSQFVARMNKNRDSNTGLAALLGEIFGIRVDKKDSINTSNFTKGAVPFDGVTRQAIISVIPGYLARIEAALTGAGERHYDMQSGTWKSAKQIRKEFDDERKYAIASANNSMRMDIMPLVEELRTSNAKAAEELSATFTKMTEKIFDDGGDFSKAGDAWKYYGFKSKKEFDLVMSYVRNNTIKELAYNNMNARQNLTQRYRDIESGIGPQGILFNGSYDPTGTGNRSKMDPSKFGGGSGLLASSMDNQGRNVFWYLREILESIHGRWKSSSGSARPRTNGPSGSSGATRGSARGRESSTESEGDSTGESDPYASIYARLDKEAEEASADKAKSRRFGDWLESKIGNTPVGKYFAKAVTGAETILTKPMEYATKLLNKADESMFRMMFGENEFKDDEGNKIDNAFAYIAYKVKKTFDDITKTIKEKLNQWFGEKIKPYWDKYGKPVVGEIKNYVGRGINRVKKAGNRLSGGRLFKNADIDERLENGDVVGTDEIVESAYGRVVTKRGLTMISPGEVIIPASFDKREQNKMLELEKRDKRRILNAIGYNAKGTVDIDSLKDKLHTIYNENRGSGAKVGAGGVLGAGAGLLAGFNPLLGALAGAGLSILDNSESFKKLMFGEETTNEDGTKSRSGGIVSKKIYDIFTKAAPDMGDFGIAGGLIGLFTPFGPLGGAAIGAGVGLLKNSEGFKKFIFGNAETGEDGLISKETYDKFMSHVKKAAPNMLIGAGAGALIGPFGLLGNAAMGAGVGLLSSTETFHKFVFGDPDDPNQNGIVGAFKTGVLEPAKEKINEILEGFKGYFKKNILDPMKNFWDPLQQTIKNTITGTSDKIKDYLNDMFERTIGIPMADFLQEKLFRPVTKLVFGILKAPIAVGKAIVAAPFRALGGIGNSMRMGQINRGTAYDMSASERLAFREQHSTRSFFGRLTGRDKMQEQDTMLANMTEEQLEALASNARVGLDSMEALQKRAGNARKAVGNEISAYFNSKGADGKSLYSRVNFNKVKAIAKKAADGDFAGAEKDIMALKGLTDEEKSTLLNNIKYKVAVADKANKDIASKNRTSGELDAEVSELIGRKFRGRKDRRQMFRSAEAELAARRKGGAAVQESPEEHATNNLAELYKVRADKIIKLFGEANEKLSLIINPNKDKEDTTPPGDKDAAKKNKTSVEEETKALMSGTKAGVGIDKASGNEDSKESVEARKKQEEQEQREQEETDETKKTNTILETIKEKFFGGGKNKNKEGNGLLSKLGSAFGTFMKFLGVGAKFGLGAVALGGGVSLLGYATEWFKTSVWPTIKGALFGKTNDDGSTTTGLLGGLGDKMKNLFLGEDGKSGLFGKFTTWLGDKFEALKNWYTGQGGISGILTNVASKMVVGWGYAINNIVTPLTAIVVKALPGLLLGLGKGILQGLKMAVFNKELPNQQGTMKIDATDTLSELSQHNTSNNALVAAMGDMGTSVKNAFATASSGAAYTAKSASEIDLSGIFSATTDNSVKSSGVAGLLGRTERTNDVEYDENGNRITNYTQFNSTDSVLSRVGDASSRAFLRGLAGDAPVKGIGKALEGLKGKGIGTGFSKIFTGFGSNVGKYAGKGMTAASNLGTKLHDKILGVNVAGAADDVAEAVGSQYVKNSAGRWIDKATGKFVKSEVAEAGMKAADNVVEAGAKAVGKSSLISKATGAISNAASKVADTGLAKGLKKIFSNLADSKIGTLIAKAAKSAGKAVDGTVVSKALLNIGESLAKAGAKTAGKAVSKIATAVAGFSPLALALMVKDFVVGYDQAYTILGVAVGGDYQVGFGQRCLCGLLNLINERITLGLIPTATIVDIIVEYLFPIFGLDAESLNAARDEAAAILDEWNAANPDEQYDNLEDFNNKDKWWKKAGNAIKDTAGKAWDGIKSGASKVGKGIASAAGKVKDGAVNLFNNAKTAVSTGFKNVSEKLSATVDNAKDIGGFLKDALAEIKKAVKDPEYHWDIDSYLSEDDPLAGVKKTTYQVMKVPMLAVAFVSNIGSKIGETIKKWAGNVKDGFNAAFAKVKAVGKGQYSIFTSQYWANETAEDPENPISKLGTVVNYATKIISIPHAMIGFVGSKIKDGLVKLVNGAKEGVIDASSDVAAVARGEYTVFNKSYWSSDTPDDGNELSKLGSVFGFASRLLVAPQAMLGYVGSKVKDGFVNLINGAKEGAIDASSDVAAVVKGEYTVFSQDYWKANTEDDGNPLSKLGSIFGFATRLLLAPNAMLGYVGTKVKDGFVALIDGAKEGALDASEDVAAVVRGEYSVLSKDYWKSNEEEDDNPLSKIGSVFGFVSRLLVAPQAMLGYVGSKVANAFKTMVDGVKDISDDTDAVVERAKNGEISVFSDEYWKMDDTNNPLGLIGNVVGFLDRLTNAPIVIFTKVFNKIKEKFDSIKGWFSRLFGEDAEEVDTESGSGRSGRGRRLYGRAHTYQNDPSIANMAYGDSTIGNAGCAPVAAVNLINRMSNNQAVNVADAARFAEQNNMTVRGGGTDINFFNQYLASHGIGSVKTSNRSAIKEALKAGSQVVMLGQDKSDAPGAPFGTNPHFITATGIDRSGNIIVEDPDMPESNITYSSNDLLNSMVSSVVVQPGMRRSKRARRSGAARKLNIPTRIRRGFGRLLVGLGGTYGADNILAIARNEIGVCEKGNSNQVKYNHAYYGSNVSGSAYPWCCAFVWWVFNQAGASHIFYTNYSYDESHKYRHRTAYCPTLMSYHNSLGHNLSKNATPSPGDIVFFNWDGGSTAQHVGIVESVSGSNVITIEGNTSGSDNTNGGCVMRRTRPKSCIIGYSRPEYPYTYDPTHVVDMSSIGDSTNYSAIAAEGGTTTSSSSSSTGTLMQQFTNLGTSMIKAMYGEDAYNALFGTTSTDATATTLSYNTNGSNVTLSGNSQADQIWNYLTGAGGYSKNAASGIMGCWHHESNNNSQRIEGDYLNGFPGYDTVVNSQSAMDNWTVNKLFPAYAKSGVSINQAAYKGTDGHYYPGIGLAQWTGPRGYNLFQYSKQTGKNWGSLENQLAFFNSEMEQRGLKSTMNSSSSPEDAAHKFLDGYEMYNGYGASAPNALNPRKQAARTMYNKYSDTVGLGRRNMQNAYAKKYTQSGGATNALNSMSMYAGGAGTVSATVTSADRAGTVGAVDYATFLQTIVTILMNISDNTALLGKVLEVLSTNFNIDIDKSDIDAAASATKAQTEAALNDLVRRSSGNVTNISKLLNNKDTEYVISAMRAIASE